MGMSFPGAAGDIVGPGSSNDEEIAVFDGTTGKLLKTSPVTIDGSGNVDLKSGLLQINSLEALSPTVLTLVETTTPATVIGSGRFYPKADNIFYFKDGSGVEHAVALTNIGNTFSVQQTINNPTGDAGLLLTNQAGGDAAVLQLTKSGAGISYFWAIDSTGTNDLFLRTGGAAYGDAQNIFEVSQLGEVRITGKGFSGTGITTVDIFKITGDTLTTGCLANFISNSPSTGARTLVPIINDNTLAVNVTPLGIQQDALTDTNFQKIADFGGSTLWRSDATDPNGNLTATAGDFCLNGLTNRPFYCTGTNVWVDLTAATLSWGESIANGTGIGFNFSVGASADSGVNPIKILFNDTQINSLEGIIVDVGLSTATHVAYKAVIPGAGSQTGYLAEMASTAQGVGFAIDYSSTDTQSRGYEISGSITDIAGNGISVAISGNNSGAFIPLSIDVESTALTAAKTNDFAKIVNNREVSTAITIVDDYDALLISRSSESRDASANFTANGSVLKLLNIATQTSGTLTDNTKVLEIVQDIDSNGAPISVEQNALTDTNFRELETETNTGISRWVSDGTTPNGNLTGTQGDTCSNGENGQEYYCSGGTVWHPSSASNSFAEMFFDNNAVAQDMETANTPIGVLNYSTGTLLNWTFNAGSTAAITAYADNGGSVAGTVLATSTHGLTTGDFIAIRGTTNYNGVFQITVTDGTHFYFTDTWVADDGASDFDQPSYLQFTSGESQNFMLHYSVSSAKGGGGAATVVFEWYVNTTTQPKTRSKRDVAGNDVGSLSGCGIITVETGDRVFLTATSSNTDNLTQSDGTVLISHI